VLLPCAVETRGDTPHGGTSYGIVGTPHGVQPCSGNLALLYTNMYVCVLYMHTCCIYKGIAVDQGPLHTSPEVWPSIGALRRPTEQRIQRALLSIDLRAPQ
jgi:hypothetical protein